ncbi:MAG: hypothetical protein RLQ12_00500 [Cyclobacteriaceae bacterium]
MKYFYAFILLIHGCIHLLGFIKAFDFSEIQQLTRFIPKVAGLLWLLVFLLFLATTIGFLLGQDWWFYLALVSVLISQILILMVWQDAKFGTIANVIILLVAMLAWSDHRFESQFHKDSQSNLERTRSLTTDLLTAADIKHLPRPVQHYLRYAGVLDHPNVTSIQLKFSGEMRGKQQSWFSFNSVQHNVFDIPSRYFFMRGKFFGLSIPGYHKYEDGKASMEISLFGVLPVAQVSGTEMNEAETVTFFNDLCLFAPAALIDDRISWEPVDDHETIATFTHGQISIKATLQFNDEGQLINFISQDRYEVSEMRQIPFSTPVLAYEHINGRNIVSAAEAIWHYSDGPFVYGRFKLEDATYNIEPETIQPGRETSQ